MKKLIYIVIVILAIPVSAEHPKVHLVSPDGTWSVTAISKDSTDEDLMKYLGGWGYRMKRIEEINQLFELRVMRLHKLTAIVKGISDIEKHLDALNKCLNHLEERKKKHSAGSCNGLFASHEKIFDSFRVIVCQDEMLFQFGSSPEELILLHMGEETDFVFTYAVKPCGSEDYTVEKNLVIHPSICPDGCKVFEGVFEKIQTLLNSDFSRKEPEP